MDKGNRSPLRYMPVVVLVILGMILGSCHNRATKRGEQDPASSLARTVSAPPSSVVGNASHWVQNQTDWIFRGRRYANENRELRDRVAQLEGENALLRDQSARYQQLRSDLGFVQNHQPALLAADILSRRIDFKFETLLIARGERDGVKPDSIVITRNGLVGRVFEVTATTASVLMITDQKSGVGARVLRPESRALGVCKGDNTNLLTLTYLDNDADIRVGDEIITSGMGGVFPSGIRIGSVKEVKIDPASAIKTAKLIPYVNFDRLEEVYIRR